MFHISTEAGRKATWHELYLATQTALADLEAEDVDTDELLDFYVSAFTRSLTAFMLEPVSEPDALLAKMKLFAEHDMRNSNDEEFDEIWAAIMADVKRIANHPDKTRRKILS